MANESIIVRLGLDNTQFSRGLKGAEQNLSLMGKAFAALGIGTIARSFARATYALTEMADAVLEGAQAAGVSTDAYQGLQRVFQENGGSAESFTKVVGELNKSLGEVAAGNRKAEAEFKKFGVEIRRTDGTLLDAEQVLYNVSDAIAKTGDASTRTATAMALLGKSGRDLIPAMVGGSQALQDAMKDVPKISQSNLEALNTFKDGVDGLNLKVKVLAANLAGLALGGGGDIDSLGKPSGIESLMKKLPDQSPEQQKAIAEALLALEKQRRMNALAVASEGGKLRMLEAERAELARAHADAAGDTVKQLQLQAALEAKSLEIFKQRTALTERKAAAEKGLAAAQADLDKAKGDAALFGSLEELANADTSRGATLRLLAEKANARSIIGQEANAEGLKQAGLTELAKRGFEIAGKRRMSLTYLTGDARNPNARQEKLLGDAVSELKRANEQLANATTYPPEPDRD